MFYINTERLRIVPLTYEHIMLLLKSRKDLEQFLGLEYSDFQLNADENFLEGFYQALRNYILPGVGDSRESYLWFTHWLVIEKEQNLTIGGIGTFGLPDKNGESMIGYFIDKKAEGMGYATEAVRGFVAWLSEHKDLKAVIAHTLPDGFGSQKVLKKNGFVLDTNFETERRWKLSVKK